MSHPTMHPTVISSIQKRTTASRKLSNSVLKIGTITITVDAYVARTSIIHTCVQSLQHFRAHSRRRKEVEALAAQV